MSEAMNNLKIPISDVSLIIPSQNAEKNLFQLLRHLVNWEIIPSEIIIIDSSQIKLNIPNEFKLFTEKNNIRLLVVHERSLYPGKARNIGINKATNPILAFLDTSTHPTKKWFRNYSFSGNLPHRKIQKDLYYYLISFVTVLIAYNWNKVIAAWDTESIYFIPNVTKISLLVIIAIYAAIRGILLPKKKGIDFKFIFPMNFIFISAISFLIDITKALAFGYSRFRKND